MSNGTTVIAKPRLRDFLSAPPSSQKRSSLLKKSLADRSWSQNRIKTPPKHHKTGVLSLEQGSERGTKEFFNTLVRS